MRKVNVSLVLDCRATRDDTAFQQLRARVSEHGLAFLSLLRFARQRNVAVRLSIYHLRGGCCDSRLLDAAVVQCHAAFSAACEAMTEMATAPSSFVTPGLTCFRQRMAALLPIMADLTHRGENEDAGHYIAFYSTYVTCAEVSRSFAGIFTAPRCVCRCVVADTEAVSGSSLVVDGSCLVIRCSLDPCILQGAVQATLRLAELPLYPLSVPVVLHIGAMQVLCSAALPYASAANLAGRAADTPVNHLTLRAVVDPDNVNESTLFGDSWVVVAATKVTGFDEAGAATTAASKPAPSLVFDACFNVFKDTSMIFTTPQLSLSTICDGSLKSASFIAYFHDDTQVILRQIVPTELRCPRTQWRFTPPHRDEQLYDAMQKIREDLQAGCTSSLFSMDEVVRGGVLEAAMELRDGPEEERELVRRPGRPFPSFSFQR